MNKHAAYFQAGYLPALVTTSANQAAMIEVLSENADEASRPILVAATERFQAAGFAEAASEWQDRFQSVAAEIGITPEPPSSLSQGYLAWAIDTGRKIRARLNEVNLIHQSFLMAHAAGTNAGEVAAHINIAMFVARFSMIVDHPLLADHWNASMVALKALRRKFAETMDYSAHPAALKAIAEPVDRLLSELTALPLRVDDGPYLLLLMRFTERAWEEIVYRLDFVEEDLTTPTGG